MPDFQGTLPTRCRICKSPTDNGGTKLCNGCWEVERRIEDFLQHEEGRLLVIKLLAKRGYSVMFPAHAKKEDIGR